MENYKEAIKYFSQLIMADPKYYQAYISRGISFLKLKHYNKSLEDFTLALEIKNDLPQAYINRAIAFRAQDKLDDAARDFIDYLILNPTDNKHTIQIKTWLKRNGFPYDVPVATS
jgi:tetratricopeptide (TPR) repeat protein